MGRFISRPPEKEEEQEEQPAQTLPQPPNPLTPSPSSQPGQVRFTGAEIPVSTQQANATHISDPLTPEEIEKLNAFQRGGIGFGAGIVDAVTLGNIQGSQEQLAAAGTAGTVGNIAGQIAGEIPATIAGGRLVRAGINTLDSGIVRLSRFGTQQAVNAAAATVKSKPSLLAKAGSEAAVNLAIDAARIAGAAVEGDGDRLQQEVSRVPWSFTVPIALRGGQRVARNLKVKKLRRQRQITRETADVEKNAALLKQGVYESFTEEGILLRTGDETLDRTLEGIEETAILKARFEGSTAQNAKRAAGDIVRSVAGTYTQYGPGGQAMKNAIYTWRQQYHRAAGTATNEIQKVWDKVDEDQLRFAVIGIQEGEDALVKQAREEGIENIDEAIEAMNVFNKRNAALEQSLIRNEMVYKKDGVTLPDTRKIAPNGFPRFVDVNGILKSETLTRVAEKELSRQAHREGFASVKTYLADLGTRSATEIEDVFNNTTFRYRGDPNDFKKVEAIAAARRYFDGFYRLSTFHDVFSIKGIPVRDLQKNTVVLDRLARAVSEGSRIGGRKYGVVSTMEQETQLLGTRFFTARTSSIDKWIKNKGEAPIELRFHDDIDTGVDGDLPLRGLIVAPDVIEKGKWKVLDLHAGDGPDDILPGRHPIFDSYREALEEVQFIIDEAGARINHKASKFSAESESIDVLAGFREAAETADAIGIISRRIENSSGQKNRGLGQAMIDMMVDAGGNRRVLERNFDHMRGMAEEDFARAHPEVMKALRNIRTVNIFTHLGLATVDNLSQGVFTAARFDIRDVLAEAYAMIRADSRAQSLEYARRVGAVFEDMSRMSEGEVTGDAAERFLNFIRFTKVEQFNRTFAANVGRRHVERTLKDLAQNPTNQRLRRDLTRLGLNPMTLNKYIGESGLTRRGERLVGAINSGNLRARDSELLAAAGFEASRATQFFADIIDNPYFVTHPLGKSVWQFRTFMYNTTRMIYNDIWGELKAGNARPFLKLVALGAVIGEGKEDVKEPLAGIDPSKRGQKGTFARDYLVDPSADAIVRLFAKAGIDLGGVRDEETLTARVLENIGIQEHVPGYINERFIFARVLENIASTGAFALWQSVFQGAVYGGRHALVELVGGLSVGRAVEATDATMNLMNGFVKMSQGKVGEGAEQALRVPARNIPIGGRLIQRTFMPTKFQKEEALFLSPKDVGEVYLRTQRREYNDTRQRVRDLMQVGQIDEAVEEAAAWNKIMKSRIEKLKAIDKDISDPKEKITTNPNFSQLTFSNEDLRNILDKPEDDETFISRARALRMRGDF